MKWHEESTQTATTKVVTTRVITVKIKVDITVRKIGTRTPRILTKNTKKRSTVLDSLA